MDDLSTQFKAQTDLYLESIQTRIAELFKESIQESIYDYYSPTEYNRTNMFLESTKTHIDLETGIMYVYSDLNSGYPSAVDGSPQYSRINSFIESGHSDSTGYGGEYHSYEKRDYLEKAKELIIQEFPELNIQILKE